MEFWVIESTWQEYYDGSFEGKIDHDLDWLDLTYLKST